MAEKRPYNISEEEREKRRQRRIEQNRQDAQERREARERGELPKSEKPADDEPIDIKLELRKIIRNPKTTAAQKTSALKALHEYEREERERAKKEADSDEVLARVHEALSARVPLTTFEEHVERWTEIAHDHGFALELKLPCPFEI